MKPKDIIFPLIIIPAGIAFVAVCTIVYLNKGKSGKLIAAKLKIGAFILSFSWFVTSTGCDTSTCYVPALPENHIRIDPAEKFIVGDTIAGEVSNRTFHYYSYDLIDSLTTTTKQSGFLSAKYNNFEDYNEYFYFLLDSSIAPGVYFLKIFGEETDKPKHDKFIDKFRVLVEKL